MKSKYLNDRLELGKKLVKTLLNKYEYVSLLGKHVTGKTLRISNFNKQIGEGIEKTCGFVIKVYHQGIYSEYSFSSLDEENFDDIVKNVENGLNVSSSLLEKHMDLSLLEDEPLVKDFDRPEEGISLSVDEIVSRLEKVNENVMKHGDKIIQAMQLFDNCDFNSFYISKNRCLTQHYTWGFIYSVAVARDGDIIKDYRSVSYGNNVDKFIKEAEEKADETANMAIALLKAETVVPGVYDIITHPSITGLIAHEAFGHGVEMDMFVKQRAKSRMYINKPVASPLVNMHDGAAATFSSASYFFDDDGVLAQDTLIIDKGILKTGISDVIAANELKTKATGNSRRESTYRKAYTRMTNTFFAPGNDNVEDMIKSIKHGYMLCEMNNGMEDPKNWNIQCTAEYGREIKDGKFTGKLISPVIMSGYVPDLLMSISMVSKDFECFGVGHCGKGHKEWVMASDGGPYLKARCKLS